MKSLANADISFFISGHLDYEKIGNDNYYIDPEEMRNEKIKEESFEIHSVIILFY